MLRPQSARLAYPAPCSFDCGAPKLSVRAERPGALSFHILACTHFVSLTIVRGERVGLLGERLPRRTQILR